VIIPEWPAPPNIVAGTTTIGIRDDELPGDIRFLSQVHGARVVTVAEVRAAGEPLDADAVTGNSAGDVCAVRTADCVPVLFCARDGSEVAAAHAGWRGLVAGVLENTVAALETAPAQLLAWLGPAISQPNFEVGEEVREAFMASDPTAAECFQPNARGRWQADLYSLAARRLAGCGVTAVYGARWCTFADPRRFHSYRRDPDCGRMVSFAGLK
jgi:YfiH family protein